MVESDARKLLVFYPAVYLACHTRHKRAANNRHQISSRDADILGHLDRHVATSPASLARHMGVTAGTMSAALDRLEKLGYVERRRRLDDARRVDVLLTAHGAQAMQDSSVLDFDRVCSVLRRLGDAERRAAVRGMEILARHRRWPLSTRATNDLGAPGGAHSKRER